MPDTVCELYGPSNPSQVSNAALLPSLYLFPLGILDQNVSSCTSQMPHSYCHWDISLN